MQLGNFRFTTPGAGLDIVLGQLPLDLFLCETAMRTHMRLHSLKIKDWQGKGPGARGKAGHILRTEKLLEDAKIDYLMNDDIPKSNNWDELYTTSNCFEGNDETEGLRLYTDGSKLNNNSGFGAVLMSGEDICDELYVSVAEEATVFQAECHAIIHGLDLVHNRNCEITILTDIVNRGLLLKCLVIL